MLKVMYDDPHTHCVSLPMVPPKRRCDVSWGALMEPTEEYPYVLITGRLLEHFNTGEMSRRTTKLSKLKPASYLDMNPQDTEAASLSENDIVRMTSPHGSVELPLKIEPSLQRGYLFAPIHFSKPNFNSLMSAVPMDPKTRMPALKMIPVKLQKVKRYRHE